MDQSITEFEWAVPRTKVNPLMTELAGNGAVLRDTIPFFVPPKDEASEYAAAAFEPMSVIVGAAALGYLLDKICELVRQHSHGGAIVDVRSSRIEVRQIQPCQLTPFL